MKHGPNVGRMPFFWLSEIWDMLMKVVPIVSWAEATSLSITWILRRSHIVGNCGKKRRLKKTSIAEREERRVEVRKREKGKVQKIALQYLLHVIHSK